MVLSCGKATGLVRWSVSSWSCHQSLPDGPCLHGCQIGLDLCLVRSHAKTYGCHDISALINIMSRSQRVLRFRKVDRDAPKSSPEPSPLPLPNHPIWYPRGRFGRGRGLDILPIARSRKVADFSDKNSLLKVSVRVLKSGTKIYTDRIWLFLSSAKSRRRCNRSDDQHQQRNCAKNVKWRGEGSGLSHCTNGGTDTENQDWDGQRQNQN